MAKTTYFYKKNGGLSSIRVTLGNSKNEMNMTTYPDKGKGGITFKNNGIKTRMNINGISIGSGLKCGNNTTYFGKNGNVVSSLPSFK
ncbi:TPA: hypothetical protein ACY4SM_001385 [Clostridium perfringens]|uniref:hypothetical protein n=1 Tax=Clostridium perfringens TaxID=1502 RepID=UPI0039E85FA1